MKQVTIPCVICEAYELGDDRCECCRRTKKYSPRIVQEGNYAWIDHPFASCVMNDKFRLAVLKYVNYMSEKGYECVGAFQYGSKWLFKCADVGKVTMTVESGRTFP